MLECTTKPMKNIDIRESKRDQDLDLILSKQQSQLELPYFVAFAWIIFNFRGELIHPSGSGEGGSEPSTAPNVNRPLIRLLCLPGLVKIHRRADIRNDLHNRLTTPEYTFMTALLTKPRYLPPAYLSCYMPGNWIRNGVANSIVLHRFADPAAMRQTENRYSCI